MRGGSSSLPGRMKSPQKRIFGASPPSPMATRWQQPFLPPVEGATLQGNPCKLRKFGWSAQAGGGAARPLRVYRRSKDRTAPQACWLRRGHDLDFPDEPNGLSRGAVPVLLLLARGGTPAHPHPVSRRRGEVLGRAKNRACSKPRA